MKNAWLQIVVLSLVVGGIIACGREKPIRLQDGRALEEQGDYLGALAYYQRLANVEFREECLHNLQHLYGDIVAALLARQDQPNSAEANYQLGKALVEKARAIPSDAEIGSNFGFDLNAYFAAQQAKFYAQAQQALESATQLQPNYQAALLLTGSVYADRNESDKAVTVYQQLVTLETDAPQAYYQLSVLLYARGQVPEALALARRAALTYPDNPDAHLVLGLLAAREGEDAEAVAAFQQTLCGDPRRPEVYYQIAQVYLRQDNFIDAERALRLGFANNPKSRKLSLFYWVLKAILDSKEQAEAQMVYEQLAEETGAIQTPTAATLPSKGGSPSLQRRHLGLRLNLLRRQQPYALPCTDAAENVYFTKEIARIQEKIDQLTQLSQSAQQPPSATK